MKQYLPPQMHEHKAHSYKNKLHYRVAKSRSSGLRGRCPVHIVYYLDRALIRGSQAKQVPEAEIALHQMSGDFVQRIWTAPIGAMSSGLANEPELGVARMC